MAEQQTSGAGRTSVEQQSPLLRIDTNGLLEMIGHTNVRVIDVRSVNAYNGWPEKDEQRGGHVQGARSLPAKWAEYIDWIEIVRAKGIDPANILVLYGYDRPETEKVARLFKRAGYEDVRVYHDFVSDWSAQGHPMEHLARYRHLVSPEWLQALIGGERHADVFPRQVICHAHYQNRPDYEQGHIPGAIPVDTNWLESTETWNRRSPDELKTVFERLGITHDTTVVLYGRFSYPNNDDPFPGSSAGHLAAMRCAFIMMYAGVEDIRILNGGIRSWLDAGYELSQEEGEVTPVDDFGIEIPQHPEYAVDLSEAQSILGSPESNLVSIRSWREYIGQVSGYNYIEKKGRIPGSVFADCGSDSYHLENYRHLDHTTREYHEIAENWARSGIFPEQRNAFYCGTGWRGSEAFINAWLMGWSDVAVYDGGWFEWSNNNCPSETGVPS